MFRSLHVATRRDHVQYAQEIEGRGNIEEHLASQQHEASLSFEHELACKDAAYTHRWRYAGLPVKPSHLRLDPEKLGGAGLLDPKNIMSGHAEQRAAELLQPPPVHEFNDSTAAPHYLAQTAAAQTRAAAHSQVLERTAELRGECKQGWRSLPSEEVQALLQKSRARAKLASVTMNGAHALHCSLRHGGPALAWLQGLAARAGAQWDAESKVIQSMRRKLGFRRNPRFDYMAAAPQKQVVVDPLLNRPPFGVTQPAATQAARKAAGGASGPFLCEPECVKIGQWAVGHTHSVRLQVPHTLLLASIFRLGESALFSVPPVRHMRLWVQIRNVSGTMRRLRLIPPASQYWHVSQVAFPTPGGLVAPGLAASVTVRFTPDSDADVRDAFTVDTELSRFSVPLLAVRAPPVIGLAARIDVGSVYQGNQLTHEVDIAGIEGSGTYQLFDSYAWQAVCEGGQAPATADASVAVGSAFVLRPARFSLQQGGTARLQVQFDAASQGVLHR